MIQVFSASTVGIQTQNGGMFQNRTAEKNSSRKHVVLSAQPFWKFALLLRMQFYYVESQVSPSSIILRLLLRLPQPGEEGCDGLEGHTLPLLLGRVFARLPLVESVLWDDVLVIQTVKEHPEKVCQRAKAQPSPHMFPSQDIYHQKVKFIDAAKQNPSPNKALITLLWSFNMLISRSRFSVSGNKS